MTGAESNPAPPSLAPAPEGPLRATDISQFVQAGFVTLHNAFSSESAAEVCVALGQRLGIDLSDPPKTVARRLWLKENLRVPPFTDALTARFHRAVDQLVGVGRWQPRPEIGWWPVTLPGYGAEDDDWHVEGSFLHHPAACEQAILPLFCFSRVEPDGGGTRLVVGSHHVAARALWQAGRSLTGLELMSAVRTQLDRAGWHIHQVVADPGDVVLAHPLLVHSGSPNRAATARVMAQPRYDLASPKQLNTSLLSAVEFVLARQSIRRSVDSGAARQTEYSQYANTPRVGRPVPDSH